MHAVPAIRWYWKMLKKRHATSDEQDPDSQATDSPFIQHSALVSPVSPADIFPPTIKFGLGHSGQGFS